MSVENNFNKAQVVFPVPLLPMTKASPYYIIVSSYSEVGLILKFGILEIIVDN